MPAGRDLFRRRWGPLLGTSPAVAAIPVPLRVSGLELWLKADSITGLADADPVTSWLDSSGNGRTFGNQSGAGRPTYRTNVNNSLPVVRGASGTWLRDLVSWSLAAGSRTAFFLCDPTNILTVDGWIFRCSSATQFTLYNSDDTLSGGASRNPGYRDSAFHDIDDPATGWQLLIWQLDGDTGVGTLWRDVIGTFLELGTNTYTSVAISGTLGFMASGPPPNAPTSFVGDVAEFLLYSRSLSLTEIVQVMDYLRDKWSF